MREFDSKEKTIDNSKREHTNSVELCQIIDNSENESPNSVCQNLTYDLNDMNEKLIEFERLRQVYRRICTKTIHD